VTRDAVPARPDAATQAGLADLVAGIAPWDDVERNHLATAAAWIASGAPLYRTGKPDIPATHLVSYFVVLDEDRGQLLLVDHRKARLWLPTGGHVEEGEDPWHTVIRETREELNIQAEPSALAGDRPFFLTVTRTRGPGQHTDVSLWYLLRTGATTVISYDQDEFAAIRWLTPPQVLAEPADTLDPHLHRFTERLLATGFTASPSAATGRAPARE
jgi:8-oxo-dGTP pyrophosphatase MutT (NUDIX family)